MWPVENIYYCDSVNIDQKSTTVVGVRSDKEISPLGVLKLRFHNICTYMYTYDACTYLAYTLHSSEYWYNYQHPVYPMMQLLAHIWMQT